MLSPTVPGPPPYRDDRDSLLDEIARLKAEVRGQKRGRLRLAVGLGLTHLVLREVLSSWLNGQSDLRFWLALIVVFGPLVGVVWALLSWARSRGDEQQP
jgi:hypothetical protein